MKPPRETRFIFRHSVVVRITHWINVVCLTVLLMSGLQIFNAHPALYWGSKSHFSHPILAMDATQANGAAASGVTTIFGQKFNTTGVLGLSYDASGHPQERGFPSWATISGFQALADGRRWHLFFA
jgi:thiosulfate reductase cytochrome b subunit